MPCSLISDRFAPLWLRNIDSKNWVKWLQFSSKWSILLIIKLRSIFVSYWGVINWGLIQISKVTLCPVRNTIAFSVDQRELGQRYKPHLDIRKSSARSFCQTGRMGPWNLWHPSWSNGLEISLGQKVKVVKGCGFRRPKMRKSVVIKPISLCKTGSGHLPRSFGECIVKDIT